MRVCGIAGSLRRASFNRALLRAAVALAPDGTLTDEDTRRHVRALLERLQALTERLGPR